MKGKLVSFAAGLLGIGGVSCAAQAQGVIEQCNGCAGRQYEQFAISLGLGDHLIGDFSNNVFSGYHVLRESSGKGGYIYEADSFAVTSDQRAAFDEYRKLIVDYHASAIIVTIPNPRPSGYPTALDDVSAVSWAGFPNYTNAMALWISSLQETPGPIGWMPTPADVPFTRGAHQIAEGVWAYIQPDGGWGRSNAGLVAGGDGATSMLVDTLFDLDLTREMLAALRAKFTQHDELKAVLLGTGDAELVEHTANDRYWGDGGDGSGKNRLGALLMQVRAEIRAAEAP